MAGRLPGGDESLSARPYVGAPDGVLQPLLLAKNAVGVGVTRIR